MAGEAWLRGSLANVIGDRFEFLLDSGTLMSAPFRGSCGCVQFSVARVGAGVWLLLAACVVAANSGMLVAAEPKTKPDPSLLTVQRLFGSSEFESESFQARWLNGEAAYTILEKSADPAGGRDIVRVDAKTGDKTVMVSAARLLPDDESQPLSIQGYAFSDDTARVLIYTNSQRVWRRKTRGDYWVLDRSSGELRQLGGEAPAASLMFAKFSPNGRHVAYVRSGNIYLEDLLDGRITALTQSASPDIINGTFDWVYEEELGLDDGFRWSKDGQSIAYWEINTTGVREFPLIRNTDGLYPRIVNIKYPKAGQTNSACRVGVVDIQSRKTTWINTPGDPRQNYIARMEWAEDSDNLILQHFNRLQNQNRVILADPRTGNVHTILTERDEAWVDVHDELFWFDNGRRFSWISERDGWRHIYVATRDGQSLERVTSGEYDVIQLLAVDEAHECVYFMASPENPTEQYLYKIGLDGHGLERITPPEAAGTHSYSLSNDQQWAIHTFSTMDSPTTIDLIKTDGHTTVRTLAKNSTLQKRVEKLKRTPTEFFRVEIAEGLALDAWCIKPPNFSANKKYPLLIYVYGEPAGQTVLNRWGGSRALWHVMLGHTSYVHDVEFSPDGTRIASASGDGTVRIWDTGFANRSAARSGQTRS